MHDPESRLVGSAWNVLFGESFKEAAVNCCTFAWRPCRLGVVFQRVVSVGCVICGSGRLQFRKQNYVNFKLQPSIDSLKPFAAIDVPVCVCEASRAPVVGGNPKLVALWDSVGSSGVCWGSLGWWSANFML